MPDESQDAVTSMFLFHELPPKVRRIVIRECARVLKPGGRLVLVDSLQCGDQADYEGLLDLFPRIITSLIIGVTSKRTLARSPQASV